MIFYPYITDNVFRLLSVPSSTSVPALLEKADALERNPDADVPVSLGDMFRAGTVPSCPALVQAVAANAATRTVHRIFWPYSLPTEDCPLATVEDLPYPDASEGWPTAIPWNPSAPAFHAKQWFLLRCLYFFVSEGQRHLPFLDRHAHEFLINLVDTWTDLRADEAHHDFLKSLLGAEGEDPAVASQAVTRAYEEAATCLLGIVLQEAIRNVRVKGRSRIHDERFRTFLDILRHSGFAPEAVEQSIAEQILPLGDRQCAKVQRQSEQAEAVFQQRGGWSPRWPMFEYGDVTRLQVYAAAMGERSPNSEVWKETAGRHVSQVGAAMTRYARNLLDTGGDTEAAQKILKQVGEMPRDGIAGRGKEIPRFYPEYRSVPSRHLSGRHLPSKPQAKVSIAPCPLVTENPYRLLALRSSASRQELRRTAEDVLPVAATGIPIEVGLKDDFGAAEMAGCEAVINRLWDDPGLRTVYRMMWLYEQDVLEDLSHMHDLYLEPISCTRGYTPDISEEACLLQCQFLSAWLILRRTRRWETLEEAFSQYLKFQASPDNRLYLERLLLGEGVTPEIAQEAVRRAQGTLSEHVVSQSYAFVAEALHGKRPAAAHHMTGKIRAFEQQLQKHGD